MSTRTTKPCSIHSTSICTSLKWICGFNLWPFTFFFIKIWFLFHSTQLLPSDTVFLISQLTNSLFGVVDIQINKSCILEKLKNKAMVNGEFGGAKESDTINISSQRDEKEIALYKFSLWLSNVSRLTMIISNCDQSTLSDFKLLVIVTKKILRTEQAVLITPCTLKI